MRKLFVFCLVSAFIIDDTKGLFWPCETNTDCNSIVNETTCAPNGKYCRCPAGHVLSTDVTKCLKESLHGELCEEDVQCSHMLSGSACTNGVCTCNSDSTYVRGRCRQLAKLHDACATDVDCFFSYDRPSVVCKNNRCQCSDGYYERSPSICRKLSMAVNDPCVVNTDCNGGTNLTCASYKCVSIGVQTGIELSQPTKTLVLTPVPIKREETGKFGDECAVNNKPCIGLHHSVCQENVCVCQNGYYHQDGVCTAELGEELAPNEQCAADTILIDGANKCTCKPTFFHRPHLRSCVKPSLNINSSCTQPSQCSPFGDSAYCRTVTPKVCACYEYATFNVNTQLCTNKIGLGEYCDAHKNCTLDHTVCDDNKSCVCKTNYFETGGTGICRGGQGELCTNATTDCALANSDCVPEIGGGQNPTPTRCQCKMNFVPYNGDCIPQTNVLGGTCKQDEQCRPLLGPLAKCVNDKCGCDETHQYSFGKCNRKIPLGKPCDKQSECFMAETSVGRSPEPVCRNSVCQCPYDYNTDTEKQVCVKRTTAKNSSGRPSPLKIVTLLLIVTAFLITTSAITEALYF